MRRVAEENVLCNPNRSAFKDLALVVSIEEPPLFRGRMMYQFRWGRTLINFGILAGSSAEAAEI